MVLTEEGQLTLKDGQTLYTKTWQPDTSSIAVLVFLHGFSDHCNAYYSVFPTLASQSITVHSFDQRGWGRSVHTPSERGLSGPTTTVLSDIHEFILHVTSLPTSHNLPLFLMGHSMGGAEALHYALNPTYASTRPHLSGLLLESPFIALDPSAAPNWFTVAAGRVAAKMFPTRQMPQKLDATYMSRSAKVRDEWVADPLCHDTGTLAGLAGMLDRAGELVAISEGKFVAGLSLKLPCPLWLGHGDGDRVTSYVASQRLFDVLEAPEEDRWFETYKGGYHKLHGEPDGMAEQFADDVAKWIQSRVGGPIKRETSHAGQHEQPAPKAKM